MPTLTNTVRVDAAFGTLSLYDTSEAIVEIPSIKVDKTSDATDGMWIGDELTYTITITNLDTTGNAENLILIDTIVPERARLVETSVVVKDVELESGVDFTYNATTGVLTIPNPDGQYVMPTLAPGEHYDVTFRVTKA